MGEIAGLSLWFIIVSIIYVLVLIGIAIHRYSQRQEMADHVLGGRRMGPISSGISAGSSLERGWALFILPAVAFEAGFAALGVGLAVVIGIWGAWKVIAPRLYRFTIAAQNALTIPDFLEQRFNEKTGLLRSAAALFTVIFVSFYVSAGLIAGGNLLHSVLGLDFRVGGTITLLVVLSYIFLGGYVVVVRTDVFQGLLMVGGVFIMSFAMFFAANNTLESLSGAFSDAVDLFTGGDSAEIGLPEAASIPIIIVSLLMMVAWAQGAFGAQRLMQRFMAVESEAAMPGSRRISTAWMFVLLAASIVLGLVANAAFAQEGIDVDLAMDEGRHKGIHLFFLAADTFLPPILGALGLSAVTAAVMSTMDSQLLLASGVATSDLPLIRGFANRRRFEYAWGAYARVWIGRFMLVVIGLISLLLALTIPNSVWDMISYAWLGMGGTFGPLIVLALYWRRFNVWGAWAALLAGGVTSIVFAALDMPVILLAVAMLAVGPLAVVVSLLTGKPSGQVVALFDRLLGKSEAG